MSAPRVDKRAVVQARFWAKVRIAGPHECWRWAAATNGRPGYGIFRGGADRDARGSKRWVLAHRYAYMVSVGPIPDGLEIDHRCRTRLCVNPTHLQLSTHRDNTLAGESPAAQQARRDVCVRGHPFDKLQADGRRRCSICDRAKELRRYELKHGRKPRPNARTLRRLAAS